MSTWVATAFWYGLGVSAGRAIFSEDRPRERKAGHEPVRSQTEAEILADEKRYEEDEKRFEEEARKLDADEARTRRP